MTQRKDGILGLALLGLTLVVAHVGAQNAPPAAPPAPAAGGPPAAQAPRRGGAPPTFPAQQRPPGDPAVVARGKAVYEANCQLCHAADMRGAATGPNLLRSQVVLSDKDGELIEPVIRGSRPGMKAIDLTPEDARAVAIYIHEIKRSARGQGAPPTIGVPVDENTIVGSAAAGKAYFDAKCTACHSVTGDLQNIGNRMPTVRGLQNLWVAGGSGGRGRAGRGGVDRRTVTVAVTLPSGEKVEGPLVNIDDFNVIVLTADGRPRTIRLDGRTRTEIKDPMEGHRALLGVLTDKDMHDVTAYLVTVK